MIINNDPVPAPLFVPMILRKTIHVIISSTLISLTCVDVATDVFIDVAAAAEDIDAGVDVTKGAVDTAGLMSLCPS